MALQLSMWGHNDLARKGELPTGGFYLSCKSAAADPQSPNLPVFHSPLVTRHCLQESTPTVI